jgi:hypothetical protein
MDARWARILAGSAFLMSLLAATWAGPAAAADCALSAPAYVNVGTPLTIEGSGFPASTSVDIAFSIEGGASDALTVQSDASGALQIALTPEDLDVGVTTVQATAGAACTARVAYTVLAAGETPPASAKPEESTATGAKPTTAPRTDTKPAIDGDGRSSTALWLLTLALVAVGSTGLFLTRSTGRR